MFTAYLAIVVLGSCGIVLLPDTRTARAAKYAIYAIILGGLLLFVALTYGQYAAHAPL
jgi:hypothetical protein